MKPYLIDKNFDLLRLRDSDGNYLFTSGHLALYVQADNPDIPNNKGIGVLNDTISCVASHEVNGPDELKLIYPVDGELFNQIQLRDIIVAQADSSRGNQPYRVYSISTPMRGRATICARHIAYDLAGIVVEPFDALGIGAALNGLNDHAMTHNPFHFVTTRATDSAFSVAVPTSVWSLLGGQRGSLLDVYGGEYTFDKYTVRLENRVGSDNGVVVRYGVNMTDLQQDANCANCYTGVVAYWKKDDEGVVYSPVVGAVGTYGYVKILPVDMSDKFDEKPTVSQLKTAAQSYVVNNEIGVPKVSWKVNFIPLETTVEYANILPLQRVGLGDTVHIKFEKLGVDATSRVNTIEWDVLLERYVSVSLGTVKSNLASTIAGTQTAVKELPTAAQVSDMSARISKALTRVLLGANGGTARMIDTNGDDDPDTFYIADNPDPAQAQKVWRWNYEGWAASSNGYNGPFVLGATLQDGIMANFITAGTMLADRIRGGTLRLGGTDNVSGVVDLFDENGVFVGKLYNAGLWVGEGNYSALHGKSAFAIRRITGDDVDYLARIAKSVSPETNNDVGDIRLYEVDSGGNESMNLTLRGDGTISCKRLFVNGTEITG